VRHYHAGRTADDRFLIQKDLRRLTLVAQLAADSLPASAEQVLRSLAVPADYQKIIDHMRLCPPKTRRIAIRCLEMWARMDSRDYMAVLKLSFFDSSGQLKSNDIGSLFSEFDRGLSEKNRETKRDMQSLRLWEKEIRAMGLRRR
jgi:hypothetical protein